MSTAFPAQAFRLTFAQAAREQAGGTSRGIRPDLGFALAVLMVAGLAIAVSPVEGLFRLAIEPRWYLYAAAAGLIAPFFEYLIGLIALRKLVPLRLHERAGTGAVAVLAVLVAAIAEEMVFRGIFLPVLSELVPVMVAVGITSVIYGLNHLYFGWLAVVQKTLTGVGFCLLFVWSGYSVLVPIAAHAIQNLVAQLLPRRKP
ncbi:CPBP family intramembrane glutamic endopeptidase [Rhizocola hellebori]|uniref:CPBP family intramembrane glutamic endopeptidase n=1 Tax=Rhizocola hellebori TaxID=1392758 RepID=UPI0019421B33|nr:CPBP family intramembrane glutamic endopeptidase [Rhizocola hellebori]